MSYEWFYIHLDISNYLKSQFFPIILQSSKSLGYYSDHSINKNWTNIYSTWKMQVCEDSKVWKFEVMSKIFYAYWEINLPMTATASISTFPALGSAATYHLMFNYIIWIFTKQYWLLCQPEKLPSLADDQWRTSRKSRSPANRINS